MWTEDVVEIL